MAIYSGFLKIVFFHSYVKLPEGIFIKHGYLWTYAIFRQALHDDGTPQADACWLWGKNLNIIIDIM